MKEKNIQMDITEDQLIALQIIYRIAKEFNDNEEQSITAITDYLVWLEALEIDEKQTVKLKKTMDHLTKLGWLNHTNIPEWIDDVDVDVDVDIVTQ